MSQETFSMERVIEKTVKLNYLLYLPEQYGRDAGFKWPLVMFLHGAGERGSDIELVKTHGIPKMVENGERFPFIAVSPQCPEDSWWTEQVDELNALLDEVIEKYQVDTARVYLTGLSMGGYGTWRLAAVHPERFAAIAPVCGGGILSDAIFLKDVPAWVFHGAKDDVVPILESEKMVEAVRKFGGDVKFTVYPEANHDSWTETYNNPELYKWLLEHKK